MKRKRSEFILAAVSLLCLLVLAACNCAPTLRYITISPANPTISAGTTQQFTATGYYSNGLVTPGINASWSSSNTAVATINGASGVATGVAAGTTTITASALGITSATTMLTVNGVSTITVTPADPSIAAGLTQQFTATANGGTDVTSVVTWSSGTTTVASISTAGLATGLTAGTSVITAALNGVSGNTTLTVTAPVAVSLVITIANPTIAIGNATLLTAQEKWTDGSLHTPSGTVTWVSSTPAQANVVSDSASTALAAGFAVGTPTITATEGTLTSPATTLTVVVGTAHFAYISNAGDLNLQSYTANATTAPYLTSTGTVGTPGYLPSQTVINPNGLYLYSISTNGTSSFAAEFSINTSTGALTSTGPTSPPIAGQSGTNVAVIDPYGRFLYVTDDGSGSAATNVNGSIYGFTISQTDGTLTPIGAVTAYTTNVNIPEGVVVDKTGNYLYVSNNGGNTISAYSINQTTGALTPLTSGATIPTGGGPWFETLDPAGANLYVANNNDGTISGYSIGSGGVLTSQGAPITVTGAQSVLNLIVSPNDKYLYVLDAGLSSGNGQVYLFTLTSGVPSSAPVGSALAVGQNPTGMAIDPTGVLLAVDNSGDHTTDGSISLFSIGSTGTLTSLTPVAAGVQPYFVTFYDAP